MEIERLGYRFCDYCYLMDCDDLDQGVAVYDADGSLLGEIPDTCVEELEEMGDEELRDWTYNNV